MNNEQELTPEHNEHQEQPEQQQPVEQSELQEGVKQGTGKRALLITLNFVIAILLLLTGYFGHNFIDKYLPKQKSAATPETTAHKPDAPRPKKVVQIDIQNGSGEKGVASRFTSYLRTQGYDVVEMKNYKISNVPHTLVIDRLGNLKTARDIAEYLGVADTNVIQQLNPDYFVDVSVVIGQDCYNLLPSK